MKVRGNRYLRVTVTPVYDAANALTHLIALTREITDETQQQLKVDAIAHAGDELADLTPEELSQLGVEERTDLLKYNIARHMKDLMGLDYIEIRLLEKSTGKLLPLLSEGMSPLAATRELMAQKEGHGVTGFVAATGQSYVCPDTTKDPLYIEGAEDARSSLTVPLVFHGTVVGTLNVESPHSNNFDDRDRQFLEIYARNIAAALNTLELLQAEKESTASASVQAISREVALPLDDIITDATTFWTGTQGMTRTLSPACATCFIVPARSAASFTRLAPRFVPQPTANSPVGGFAAGGNQTTGGRFRRGHPPLGASLARCSGRRRGDGARRS